MCHAGTTGPHGKAKERENRKDEPEVGVGEEEEEAPIDRTRI